MALSSWLHATVYKFTKVGRREVIAVFDSVMQDPAIRCRYLSDVDMFEIECPDHLGDAAYTRFEKICSRYIEQNLAEKGMVKVFRILESQSTTPYDFIFEEYERLIAGVKHEGEVDPPEVLIDVTGHDEEELDGGYAWYPEREDTDILVILPDFVIDTIALDSGCHLKIDSEKRCVIVQGFNRLTAARKLWTIERISHRKKVASHVVYTEKLTGISIQLTRLMDIPHNLLLRTMIPKDPEELAIALPRMRTCRMVRYDSPTKSHATILSPPRMPDEPKEDLLQAWSSLHFPEIAGKQNDTTHNVIQTRPPATGDRSCENPSAESEAFSKHPDRRDSSYVAMPSQKKSRFDIPPPDVVSISNEVPTRNPPLPSLRDHSQAGEDKTALETPCKASITNSAKPSGHKSRFDIPPQAASEGKPDLISSNELPKTRVYIDDLKRDALASSYPIVTGTLMQKKQSIAHWASQVPHPSMTQGCVENAAQDFSLPPKWSTVASKLSSRDGNNSPRTNSVASLEIFPPLSESQSATPQRTILGPSSLSRTVRSLSPAPLTQEDVSQNRSTHGRKSRKAQYTYREIPLRYEETDFREKQAWAHHVVGAHPSISKLLDVSTPAAPLAMAETVDTTRFSVLGHSTPIASGSTMPYNTAQEKSRNSAHTNRQQDIQSASHKNEDEELLISFDDVQAIDTATVAHGSEHGDLIDLDDGKETLQGTLGPALQPATSYVPPKPPTREQEEVDESDSVCERIQQIAEPETRRFFKTMTQQKRSKKKTSSARKSKAGSHYSTSGLPLPEMPSRPLSNQPREPLLDQPNRLLPEHPSRPLLEQPSRSLARPVTTQADFVPKLTTPKGTSFEPKQLPRLIKHEPNDVEEQKDAMLRILDHARSFKGQVDIEIQIGQALLHSIKPGEPLNFAKTVLNPDVFQHDLEKHLGNDELKLHFSRRLCTNVAEACRIPASDLWEQEPCLREVFYEFVLLDREKEEIRVRVNSDSNNTKIMPPSEDLGLVYMHFPKRVWDARFAVIGRKDYEVPTAVRELIDSLAISVTDEEHEGESFQVPKIMFRNESKEVSVVSACSKRSMHHQSIKQGGVALQVTEVRQFELVQKKSDPASKHAYSDFPAIMVEDHLLWFEASIHVSRSPLLATNLDIQLGDEADWKPEDILSMELLGKLKSITVQQITHLDGVGFGNRGLRGNADDVKALERAEQEKRDAATGRYQPFW